ncbi:MAG TPA: hypothetical protein VGR62_17665 [Candidatus Binatia bacterium]|jgi:hypothetical protein|nr:hypothetical protein [Candidatus Binatia bacterium]
MTARSLLGILLLIATIARAEPTTVVSDLQVSERGTKQYVLQVRSTAAQPFDVVPSGKRRRLTVALHGARLGKIPAVGRTPFGRVKLKTGHDGDVVLRLQLRKGWKASVRQGGSPNVVDVRIER